MTCGPAGGGQDMPPSPQVFLLTRHVREIHNHARMATRLARPAARSVRGQAGEVVAAPAAKIHRRKACYDEVSRMDC
jgi:hypothetical protein